MPHWHVEDRGWVNELGHYGPPPKQHHAWIWPNDARRSKSGRFRDILNSKGPDIFVASNPNRASGAIDGPTRRRWAGHQKFEDSERDRLLDSMNHFGGARRTKRPYYDFLTRRYRPEYYFGMWTDVKRYPGAPKNMPSSFESYPNVGYWNNIHPLGMTALMDSKNFGMNYVNGEPEGGGGYYHPGVPT